MPVQFQNRCKDLRLTPRESETLYEMSQGQTTKSAAQRMGCSQATVDFHSRNIRRKLKAANFTQAIGIVLLPISVAA